MSLTNLARILVITFFLFLAGVAIWLDFTHEEKTAYVIVDSGIWTISGAWPHQCGARTSWHCHCVVSIDYLNEKRQEEDQKKQLKASLIREMGSSVQSVLSKQPKNYGHMVGFRMALWSMLI